MLRNAPWKSMYVWLVAAFFVFGGLTNIFTPDEIRADYLRWGYPDWFRFLTGTLEITAAALIALHSTRLWGAILGSIVMTGAVGTLFLHGEFTHAITPLLALVAVLAVAGLNRKTRGPI
jgi:hypothetical protein